jgi:hypothetical protein
MPDLNYFVCTLGQAAEAATARSKGAPTVNDLLDFKADHDASKLAVGFPVPPEQTSDGEAWDFISFCMEHCAILTPHSHSSQPLKN